MTQIFDSKTIVSMEQYLTDGLGNRIGVLLDIATYQRLLERLEELESYYFYDEAIASEDESIPLEQAIVEIEQSL
jgi:hypothetical protein